MEDWWTLILSILTGVVGVYYYLYRKASYFKDKGIPYIPATPMIGNMGPYVFRRLSLPETIQKLYNMRPDVKYFGFFDFMNPVVMIRDLELIKTVAIKNFDSFQDHPFLVDADVDPFFGKNLLFLRGDEWREVRALLTPTYTSSKMKMMYELVTQCGKELADYLTAEALQPIELEMKDIFTRHTNDVIASSAFGVGVNSLRDKENEFYTTAKKATSFRGFFIVKFMLSKASPFLTKLFGLKLFGNDIRNFFNKIIGSTVAMRNEKGIVRKDLVQMMMQAQDRGTKKIFTIEEMTSQAFIFFLGGFDTSSTLMSWAAYEIATNPTIQEKLHAEIDAVLAGSQNKVTYEALQGMRYLDAIVSETLRLYPPFSSMDRVCNTAFELPPAAPGLPPLTVEVGSSVLFPCYAIHRDPKYFPNPEKFEPERFLEVNKENIPACAYFPFGLGPRSCIGNRFALTQAKVALFHLLAKCKLSQCSKTSIPMKFERGHFGTTSESGFWLKIQRRF